MKKHLSALERMTEALRAHELLTPQAEEALAVLKAQLKSLPREKSLDAQEALPPPAELAGLAQGLALYTDGACRGNPGPGSWACIGQTASGELLLQAVGHESLTTNNKMEIQAVIGAYRQFEQQLLSHPFTTFDPVLLFTDSKYVVDGLNQWIPGWRARGWKKADGKSPENLELWQELAQLKEQFPIIKVGWVRGHNGHPQNEYCDHLANRLLDEEGF